MSSEELQRWAKTTEFPNPIRWGDMEARILAEPRPTADELAEISKLAPAGGIMGVLLRALVSAPVVVPTMGSSMVGLGFVVAYVGFDKELPSDWGIALQILFGIAVIMAVFPIFTWWESRRRGWENLGLSGVTALASAGSVILLSTTTKSPSGVWPSVSWLALIAAAVAVVEFVFFLLFAKPPPRVRLSERMRHVSPEEMWLRGERATVIEQLRKRGLINDADSIAIIALPPDTWQQLESLPDGRVVRRL